MDGLDDTSLQELADGAGAVLELHHVLLEQLGPVGAALLNDVEMPLEAVLVDMEHVGIAVDLQRLHALRTTSMPRSRW
ncbi:MAG: hypothetical protein R2687_01035 [Candidatus Nanopelagicales bacterium]